MTSTLEPLFCLDLLCFFLNDLCLHLVFIAITILFMLIYSHPKVISCEFLNYSLCNNLKVFSCQSTTNIKFLGWQMYRSSSTTPLPIPLAQSLHQLCKSCSHFHDFHTSDYHGRKRPYGFWRVGDQYANVFLR